MGWYIFMLPAHHNNILWKQYVCMHNMHMHMLCRAWLDSAMCIDSNGASFIKIVITFLYNCRVDTFKWSIDYSVTYSLSCMCAMETWSSAILIHPEPALEGSRLRAPWIPLNKLEVSHINKPLTSLCTCIHVQCHVCMHTCACGRKITINNEYSPLYACMTHAHVDL